MGLEEILHFAKIAAVFVGLDIAISGYNRVKDDNLLGGIMFYAGEAIVVAAYSLKIEKIPEEKKNSKKKYK